MQLEYPVLIIPAVVIGFFAMIVATALVEKHLIKEYTVPAEGEELPLTAYGRRANEAARQRGYIYKGICHDARGSFYKTRIDFWMSPDNLVLARNSCGTIAGLPCARMILFSQLEDGHYLQTTDMKGETDFSGLTDLQIWPKYDFPKLVKRHDARMKDQAYTAVPLSDSPLRDFLAFNLRRAERLVDQGDAWFVDDDKMVWKYTLKGALRFYLIAVWGQTARRGLRKVGLS